MELYKIQRSFNKICHTLGFSWGKNSDGSIFVAPKAYWDYADIQLHGAGRVIAYINNHWNFKVTAHIPKNWAIARNRMKDNFPTNHEADLCCLEAYNDFVKLARDFPNDVSLYTFCKMLEIRFKLLLTRDFY